MAGISNEYDILLLIFMKWFMVQNGAGGMINKSCFPPNHFYLVYINEFSILLKKNFLKKKYRELNRRDSVKIRDTFDLVFYLNKQNNNKDNFIIKKNWNIILSHFLNNYLLKKYFILFLFMLKYNK